MIFSGLLAGELASAALLLLICWQDWRTRSVSWPVFPLLAACLLACRLGSEPLGGIGAESAASLLAVSILLSTLWLYVRLRFRTTGRGLLDCLGIGDVLFWLVLTIYLPPVQLLLFLFGSSLAGLLLVALGSFRALPGEQVITIPLAGVQAACLLGLLAGQHLFPGWSPLILLGL
jgi:Flp pilus assembly protein protease CpaA